MISHLPTEPLTYGTLSKILLDLQPSQSLVYYTGLLGRDSEIPSPEHTRVRGVQRAAMEAYERGQVTLVQRRLREGVYEYIAVRLSQPARNVARLPRLAALYGDAA